MTYTAILANTGSTAYWFYDIAKGLNILFLVCCIGWTYKYPCNCQGDKCEYHRNNDSERLCKKKSRNKDEQFLPGKGWYLTE